MPALPDIVGTIRCDMVFSDGTDTDVQSRMFFNVSPDASLSQTAVSAFAEDFYNLVAAHADLWHGDVALTEVRVTDLSSAAAPVGIFNHSTPGSRVGDVLPAGVATCVSYSIARRYRGGRPRNYFPWGVSVDLAGPNAWASGWISGVSSAVETITSSFSGMSSDGHTVDQHVNVSYYEGFTVEGGTGGRRAKNVSTPRSIPLVDPIVGHTVVPYPGSQRRRNRK